MQGLQKNKAACLQGHMFHVSRAGPREKRKFVCIIKFHASILAEPISPTLTRAKQLSLTLFCSHACNGQAVCLALQACIAALMDSWTSGLLDPWAPASPSPQHFPQMTLVQGTLFLNPGRRA